MGVFSTSPLLLGTSEFSLRHRRNGLALVIRSNRRTAQSDSFLPVRRSSQCCQVKSTKNGWFSPTHNKLLINAFQSGQNAGRDGFELGLYETQAENAIA